jgi:putative copper export protein
MYKLFVALHLLGAAIWLGGHIVLVTVVLPPALRARNPAHLLEFEARFERVGIPALIVQVLTGLWLAYHWVPDFSDWFSLESSHSQLILTKLGLLAATVGLAAHARLRLIPNLTAQTLPLLGYHVATVTLLAVIFLVVGMGIRTGGLF